MSLTDQIKKIFGNQEVADQPFPEVQTHTHNGIDSVPLAPQSVGGVQLKSNSVGDSNLMDLSVTEEKLAALAVATGKIKDDAITAAKVWKGGAVITLSAQMGEAVIGTAHIQDAAIINAKIGNLEVGNSKIMNAAISTAKIQDLAVTNAEIANETITNSKIGNLQVGNSKIMNAAISTAKIQDLAVGWAEIADAAIGNSKIMNAAISTAKIQDLAVTNAEIANINAGKITTGSMSAERIYGGIAYLSSLNINMCGMEALNVAGNINKTGWSSFVIPHPLKPGHRLIYTGIEAAEILVVSRGSDQLANGEKEILLPDHFQAVSDPRKVTAYVTAREDCKGLFIKEIDKNHLVIKESAEGNSNAVFDYIVFTIRNGTFDHDFEPEGEMAIKAKNETEDAFKQRYFSHRVKEIRKQKGVDTEAEVEKFTKEWHTTPAVERKIYVQPN